MGSHLDKKGRFQSDKYPKTPADCVPLKVTDKSARDLLWEYAERRRAKDTEFSDDLQARLKAVGYNPPSTSHDQFDLLFDLYQKGHLRPEAILEVLRLPYDNEEAPQEAEEEPPAEKATSDQPIVPAVPHDALRIDHRIFEGEDLADMKAHYRLDLLDPDGEVTAPGIIFHKGSPVEGWHGWTTAHVIRGLIAHMDYHQSTKFKCDQNEEILGHLKAAHKATERRVEERKSRGVLYDTEKP